jgi:hypothetical protein
MNDGKLARIKELIIQREQIDAELASLIDGTEPPKKRGRPPKEKDAGGPAPLGSAASPGS